MSLSELFEMQRVLDERIVKEKGLEGQDLLPQKILALQVELGECANEWRGFKYWSMDQLPRNYCKMCHLIETPHKHENPLLEEYIDCLHFILSIGLVVSERYGITHKEMNEAYSYAWDRSRPSAFETFNLAFLNIADLYRFTCKASYLRTFENFVYLGGALGLSEGQIVEAYKAKNAINHERQDTGY